MNKLTKIQGHCGRGNLRGQGSLPGPKQAVALLPLSLSPVDLSQGPTRGVLGKVAEPTWVTSQFQPQDLTHLWEGSDPAFNNC